MLFMIFVFSVSLGIAFRELPVSISVHIADLI